MVHFQTIFEIPDWIVEGLKCGEYVRIGGVIRDAKTKQIIAMLRETVPNSLQASTLISQANFVINLLNLGASILNLGISIIGFTLILKKLEEVERRFESLNRIQESVNNLHDKFDNLVDSNFRAALDLARDAITMSQSENRKSAAMSAVNRFLEAQHIYSSYIDRSLQGNIAIASRYILSLSLAYTARARCYLELEEITSAVVCLQEGSQPLRYRIEQYIKALFLSQPIARQVPSFIGGPIVSLDSPVELHRLGEICKWLEPELKCISDGRATLFEAEKISLVKFVPYKNSFFAGIFTSASASPGLFSLFSLFRKDDMPIKQEDTSIEAEEINSESFIKIIEDIEQLIETYNRFEAYLLEVQVIQQQRMSFQNWLQQAPSVKSQQHEAESAYIICLQ